MQSNTGSSDQQTQPPATAATQQNRQSTQSPSPAVQQQWMAMQYPPAAMVMPPHMMPHYVTPPPHYMAATPAAYHHHYHSPQHPYMQAPPSPMHHGGGGGYRNSNHHRNNGDASSAENKTLWVGDLNHWMDEQYLNSCFSSHQVVNIKIIRNKHTCFSEGYGFVEFDSHSTAEKVLQTFASMLMPNTEQPFRLNWASFSTGEKRVDSGTDHSIFVGDLAADVTDYVLQETFRARYHSVKGAKVVIDRATMRTKGYGFVKFADEGEQMRAMQEMNGVLCSTRPMRVGAAANKKTSNGTGSAPFQSNQGGTQGQGDSDPNNTTIFIGNLDGAVTDEHLRQVFSEHGELVHVKIPVGKRCGFVQFVNRSSAEDAIRILNGTPLCGANIRLSWGRSPSNKQDNNVGSSQPQWNNAPNYYPYAAQDPNMYGYAAQHPNMYGYGYPGYNNYPVPEQQQQQLVQQQQ